MVFNPEGERPGSGMGKNAEVVFINPTIVKTSEGFEDAEEGCLSFPDMAGEVRRHKWVKVAGLNLKGKPIKKKYTGWTARIFQHEFDHLDGVVYVDRLDEKDRSRVAPDLAALEADFGDGEKATALREAGELPHGYARS